MVPHVFTVNFFFKISPFLGKMVSFLGLSGTSNNFTSRNKTWHPSKSEWMNDRIVMQSKSQHYAQWCAWELWHERRAVGVELSFLPNAPFGNLPSTKKHLGIYCIIAHEDVVF